MNKNARATIPAPKLTPPTAAEPAVADVAINTQQIHAAQTAPPPAPRPEETVKPRREIVANGILFYRPTIELAEHVFLNNGEQTKKLTPEKALVAHGVLLVDELEIAVPLSGAVIRLVARSPHVHPKR